MSNVSDKPGDIIIRYEPDSAFRASSKTIRLDQFLAESLKQFSRARIQKLIEEKQVFVDGCLQKPSYKLRAGQEIKIMIPLPVPSLIEAQAIPLDTIYEDEYLAVINKPAGMVVHPGAGVQSGTLVHALMHHMQGSLSGIGGVLRPGIVHRLDKDTSGLLVVAKADRIHQHLAKQIQSKEAKRIYLAVLEGFLPEQTGSVNAPIGRHPRRRTEMAIVQGGREAQTVYKVMATADSDAITSISAILSAHKKTPNFSLLQLFLKTGRTHQIRVHMASLDCPVVGDIVYNHKATGNAAARKKLGLAGHALHAWQLSFLHPVSLKPLEFKAPLPADLSMLIGKLFPSVNLDG